MTRIYRILALAVAISACLPGEEVRRPEDKKRMEEEAKKRRTSEAKWRDPKGNLKTNVKVNRAFETALKGGAKDKNTGTPPKDKSGAPPAAPPSAPKPNSRRP